MTGILTQRRKEIRRTSISPHLHVSALKRTPSAAPRLCTSALKTRSKRRRHTSSAVIEILLVCPPYQPQVILKRRAEGIGQHSDAIVHALTIAHSQLALREIEVFDPQAHAFHEP